MERSEETLSTRDLARPNESAADRRAVADSTEGGPETAAVYDQEREGQDERAGRTRPREEIRTEGRGEEGDPSGAVVPPDADAATAAGEDESAVLATSGGGDHGGFRR